MYFRASIIATLSVAALATAARAQTALSPPEAQNRLVEAAQARPPVIVGEFRVQGQRVYNAPVLAARRIVFEPGSSLLFSHQTLGLRRNAFVFAQEVASEDPEKPGLIGWEKTTPNSPPPMGTAAAGADNGSREGASGGAGQNGRQGYIGQTGDIGPDVTLVALKVSPTLKVDISGGPGGNGANGESGARGGGGGYGNPASQNCCNCNRGAGDGSPGGPGGSGGPGGDGGTGGAGGTFTLVTPSEQVAVLTRVLQVNLAGGTPGLPGPGGKAGPGGGGGPGGQGGRHLFCWWPVSGRRGQVGSIGWKLCPDVRGKRQSNGAASPLQRLLTRRHLRPNVASPQKKWSRRPELAARQICFWRKYELSS